MQEPTESKKCDICSRSFARSEHLTRHRLIHTKERPFSCRYCGLSCQRSDVRASHVRKHHSHALEHQDDFFDSLTGGGSA